MKWKKRKGKSQVNTDRKGPHDFFSGNSDAVSRGLKNLTIVAFEFHRIEFRSFKCRNYLGSLGR